MTAQAALNAPRHRFMNWVAQKGQDGDNEIGHLSTGDAIVPVEKTRGNPRLQALLHQVYQEAGIDPRRFVVGHPQNRRNQKTGLREFADGGDSGGDAGGGSDAGGGDTGGGGETGGGANAPGTGGNIGGAGPASGGPGGNSPGTASETATEANTVAADQAAAAAAAAAPASEPPGYSVGPHGWLSDVQDALSFLGGDVSTPPGESIGKMALNAGFGLLAGPVAGGINSVSGMLGGQTVGDVGIGALGALGAAGTSGPASTGSGGSLGSGGDGSNLPADQQSQDAEWLKRLNLA